MTKQTPINYTRLAFPLGTSMIFIMIGIYLIGKSEGNDVQFYVGWANILFFSGLILFAAYKIIRGFSKSSK